MAGVVLHWLVLEHLLPSLHLLRAGIQCDNSTSVRWSTKFSAKSLQAGHHLRALALQQQICGSALLLLIPFKRVANIMADISSRFHSDTKLFDASPSLLNYFNTNFPQTTSWQEFHLQPKLILRVMLCLRDKPLTSELWQRLPGLVKSTGPNGAVMQQASMWTCYSNPPTPLSETLSSQLLLHVSVQATTAFKIKSKFKVSAMRYQRFPIPSNWLA